MWWKEPSTYISGIALLVSVGALVYVRRQVAAAWAAVKATQEAMKLDHSPVVAFHTYPDAGHFHPPNERGECWWECSFVLKNYGRGAAFDLRRFGIPHEEIEPIPQSGPPALGPGAHWPEGMATGVSTTIPRDLFEQVRKAEDRGYGVGISWQDSFAQRWLLVHWGPPPRVTTKPLSKDEDARAALQDFIRWCKKHPDLGADHWPGPAT